MNKKILNCILFLLISVIISSPAFANPIDDIVGYWELKSDKINEILTITPNSITYNKQKPTLVVISKKNNNIILTDGADKFIFYSINLIDKNTIKVDLWIENELMESNQYTQIDEATAKKYIKERPKIK